MDILNESIKISEVISAISQSAGMPVDELVAEIASCVGRGLSLEDSLIYIFDHNF